MSVHGTLPHLSAINDQRSLSEGLDRTHIHGTHLPVEEPSTASEANIRSQHA
jgi:hypothetical protein